MSKHYNHNVFNSGCVLITENRTTRFIKLNIEDSIDFLEEISQFYIEDEKYNSLYNYVVWNLFKTKYGY